MYTGKAMEYINFDKGGNWNDCISSDFNCCSPQDLLESDTAWGSASNPPAGIWRMGGLFCDCARDLRGIVRNRVSVTEICAFQKCLDSGNQKKRSL